jgi:hypothetical protein
MESNMKMRRVEVTLTYCIEVEADSIDEVEDAVAGELSGWTKDEYEENLTSYRVTDHGEGTWDD